MTTSLRHSKRSRPATTSLSHMVIAQSTSHAERPPFTVRDLEAAVRKHGHRMLSVARRYFSCDADCADAVQDAYLAAVRYLPRFRGGGSLATWLHRIVVNACLMKLRAQSRRHVVPLDEHDPPVRNPAEDHALWHEETRDAVRFALRELSEHQRTIIQLRYFEGFNTAQTAELLGLNVAAVKTRLHRSRRALERRLKGKTGEVA